MSKPISPLREGDLPPREKSLWKMSGPGALMVGLSIGSGELILWPWITAKFGAGMAWAPALAIFLQLWINVEIGRWAIASGESAITGFARVSKCTVYYFMALLFTAALLPGWARASGTAVRFLIFGLDGPGADWLWTALVYLLVAIVLFGPKRIYSGVELCVSALVLAILVGLLVVAFQVGSTADMATMARGVANVGHIELDEEFPFLRFFGALVFAGAGGFGNLYYAYWLRDKGIGMGKRIPTLVNPLRGREERASETGYIYPETEENQRRFRDWLRYVVLDNTLFFWLLSTFTTLLFMFAALVTLHQAGIVPERGRLIWDLAVILEGTMGAWGRYLFLVIAIGALFSTQLAITDGSARLWTDFFRHGFAFARNWTSSQCYLWLAPSLMVLGTVSTWFFDTFDVSVLDFFFLSAGVNGFAMAVYTPLILYVNLKFLPKSARPGPLNIFMVGCASLMYASFALYVVWTKIAA